MTRLFIALPVPDEAADALQALQNGVPDARWVPPENFHVTLAFCGEREGEFDIYTIPADGGPETRLTTAKGLDDGPEYAPDGKAIYFNSVRTGTMQIWRMKPDGADHRR